MKIPLEKLLALLPVELLDRLALRYRVNAVNQIRLTGQLVFVCLLNSLVNQPKLTQRLLEETYAKLTGKTADPSSFGKRLATLPPEYVEALFRHLHRQLQPRVTGGDQRALRLRIVDATPGCFPASCSPSASALGVAGAPAPRTSSGMSRACSP